MMPFETVTIPLFKYEDLKNEVALLQKFINEKGHNIYF